MKKYTILLFLLLPLFVSSQYHPLVKEGGIWRVYESYLLNPPFSFYSQKFQYLIEGDTIINNTLYKNLFYTNYDSIITIKNKIGVIREDSTKKVYYRNLVSDNLFYHSFSALNEDSLNEFIIYDFSINVGDTFKTPWVYHKDSLAVVETIDSIQIGSSYRRRITLQSIFPWKSKDPMYDIWIEGIGSTSGLFYTAGFEFENWPYLACYEDSLIFWSNPQLSGLSCYEVSVEEKEKDNLQVYIYPNPTSDVLNIQLNTHLGEKDYRIFIMDLSGRIITEYELNSAFLSINVGDLNSGIYLLSFFSDQQFIHASRISVVSF